MKTLFFIYFLLHFFSDVRFAILFPMSLYSTGLVLGLLFMVFLGIRKVLSRPEFCPRVGDRMGKYDLEKLSLSTLVYYLGKLLKQISHIFSIWVFGSAKVSAFPLDQLGSQQAHISHILSFMIGSCCLSLQMTVISRLRGSIKPFKIERRLDRLLACCHGEDGGSSLLFLHIGGHFHKEKQGKNVLMQSSFARI